MSHPPALGPRGEGWVIGQFVLFAAIGVLGLPGLASLPPATVAGWTALVVGLGLIAAGVLLGGMGVLALGPRITALPRPRSDAELVESGVYRLIRHPIYVGVALAGIGWAIAMTSLPSLVAAAVLVTWFDLKARREEAWLLEHFVGYAAYRSRTRRFVPWIY